MVIKWYIVKTSEADWPKDLHEPLVLNLTEQIVSPEDDSTASPKNGKA